MKETIFKVEQENDHFSTEIPDASKAVLAISEIVHQELVKGNHALLDFILAIVVHILAREKSGGLQKNFIDNLNNAVPEYRKHYNIIDEELKKQTNS